MHRYRPEVGVDLEMLAQCQEPGFGAMLARRTIERRIAHSSEQHGIRLRDGVARRRREGLADTGKRRGADRVLGWSRSGSRRARRPRSGPEPPRR